MLICGQALAIMNDQLAGEVDCGPFRLDAPNSRLLRDGKPVALTPKAFDVLRYLTSQPDRLVTKSELLSAVWPDVLVTDASVKVCVGEIRKALRDSTKVPKYIETVHRRGYRFIAPIAPARKEIFRPTLQPLGTGAGRLLVGRDEQIAHLRERFERAL